MELYNIPKEIKNDLENIPDQQETLDENLHLSASIIDQNTQLTFESKVKGLAAYVENTKAYIKALKEHEESIANRRKSLERKVLFWKDWLRENMLALGINKISSPFMNISCFKTGMKKVDAEVNAETGESLLPKKFIKKLIKTIYYVDKEAIKHVSLQNPMVDKQTGEFLGYKSPKGSKVTDVWAIRISTGKKNEN